MVVEEGASRFAVIDAMKAELKALCRSIDQSVVIQSGDIYRRSKKLVVFDVESSLVRPQSLDTFFDIIRERVDANTL